jgi:hypothetical protein
MRTTTLKEAAVGLLWASAILVCLFIHYGMSVDVPSFRYLGY